MAAPPAAATLGTFVPRSKFEVSQSIIRSYFLGHHASALATMRKTLTNISLIIECRDSRVPLTSTNPLLENSLAGRDRIIVYTKSDLAFAPWASRHRQQQQNLLGKWHAERRGGGGSVLAAGSTEVVFTDEQQPKTIQRLLDAMKERARNSDSLTGLRAMVVGMPNAGKSTLLNAMRRVGMKLPKAARTGAQPGVTRKLATPVRVLDEDVEGGIEQGVFVVDTPGVFVPYVSDVNAMLKLSLVGCVKDSVVPVETLADYLLYHLNLVDPTVYKEYSPPTNDVMVFLAGVGLRTGKLEKGGTPSQELAATWIVQQWRKGVLGQFGLDEVSEETLKDWARRGLAAGVGEQRLSMNQARKREKEARKAKNLAKRAAAADPQ